MMSKAEIRNWLKTLPNDALIGVDEGGLCLAVHRNEGIYLEIGGLPDECYSCARCGNQVAVDESVDDEGTSPEAGKTFHYCSEECKIQRLGRMQGETLKPGERHARYISPDGSSASDFPFTLEGDAQRAAARAGKKVEIAMSKIDCENTCEVSLSALLTDDLTLGQAIAEVSRGVDAYDRAARVEQIIAFLAEWQREGGRKEVN